MLGDPIEHSLSPVLHRAAYRSLGLADRRYDAVRCGETELPALVVRCAQDPAWAGLSLTMPLKRAVLPLLDDVTPIARAVGAANTVLFTDAGIAGDNTDVPGLRAAIVAGLPGEPGLGDTAGQEMRDRGVVVLGGGATAASTVAALSGFDVRRVTLVVRDAGRAAGVLHVAERLDVEVEVRTWDDVPRLVGGTGLVVSTVPGPAAKMAAHSLAGASAGVVVGGARPGPGLLLDVAYDPWPTPLAQVWTALGGRVLGGLALLVHQAVDQVQLMTGVRPDVAVLAEAGRTELAARSGERARPGP